MFAPCLEDICFVGEISDGTGSFSAALLEERDFNFDSVILTPFGFF
jgi:hypothetical protein